MECLYAILDTKSNVYGAILTFKNDAVAVRAFTEELVSSDGNSLLAMYPTDYCLFCIGHYDKETGNIVGSSPQLVITGFDAVTKAVDEVRRRAAFKEALSGIKKNDEHKPLHSVSDSPVLPIDDSSRTTVME